MVETGRAHRRGCDPRVTTKGNASWLCTRLQRPPPAYRLASVINEGRTCGGRCRLRKRDLVRSAYQTAVMHDSQRVHTGGQSHVHTRRAFWGAGMTIRRILGTTEALESAPLGILQDEIRQRGVVFIKAKSVRSRSKLIAENIFVLAFLLSTWFEIENHHIMRMGCQQGVLGKILLIPHPQRGLGSGWRTRECYDERQTDNAHADRSHW